MAYLRVYLNDALLNQVELNQQEFSIGRNPDCDLILDNRGVSSHHATIQYKNDWYTVIDNKSTNGVFVNGERITEHTLTYWDEIQIYNYVLKFMTSAGLHDQADPDMAIDTQHDSDKTVAISISDVSELVDLRDRKKSAYLTIKGADKDTPSIAINQERIRIGRAENAVIRTSGWIFSPMVAAEMEKRQDGYYLIPKSRGKVLLNNRPLTTDAKLTDGDHLNIRNLSLIFRHHLVNA